MLEHQYEWFSYCKISNFLNSLFSILPLQSDITVPDFYRVKLPVVLNKIKKEKNQRKYPLKKKKKESNDSTCIATVRLFTSVEKWFSESINL